MATISIHGDATDSAQPSFRAVAGSHQSIGRTAGEALDSLLAQEGQSIESSTILIQRFAPDTFFSQAQHDRMQNLMDRRATLTGDENQELDALIGAELDATVLRAEAALKRRAS